MSDDTTPGPNIGSLRAASANLMVANLSGRFWDRFATAAELERYYLTADALGVSRDRAAEILRNVQYEWAGSTPIRRQVERARCDLIEEGRETTMPEELWAMLRHLASETRFCMVDLTAAVDLLQSRAPHLSGPPWPVERIVASLPQLADGAAMGRVSLLSFVANVRAVCAEP